MTSEDESKQAQAPTLQETAKTLEEKIFDAKDATLRLWERNRHLQQRIGGLERRVRMLTWLALGLLLGSVGLGAAIAKQQLSSLQDQVIALQETLPSLQARLEEFAGTLQTRVNTAASTRDDARSKQIEQEVQEAIKKIAPALLAKAGQESGQGGSVSKNNEPLVSVATSAVTKPTGAPVRLVVGSTNPHKTPWMQYNHGGIYIDIDTSSAGFASTPSYFTSLSGHTNNWMAQGVTSIYLPTATGFRVHVGYRELTAEQANSWGWSVSWLAIGQ